ncbi:MAG: hypothetical protein ACOX4J_02225 [Anaerovoracaceae bacterium]|jgi:cellulose biosynthesis protein BcsQ
MNQIRLLILHTDTEYASALARALALKDVIYAITLAPEEERCYTGVMEEAANNVDKKYDLILIDEEWKKRADLDNAENRERLIGLSETPFPEEEKGYIFSEDEKRCSKGYVYKYGGLERISSELQIIYSEVTGKGRIFLHNNQTKLIGFSSGAGGVGTSCIAIATGRELASIDKRDALYLSFEESESTSIYFPTDQGRASISEYLYYLFSEGREESASFVDSFLISDMYGLCAFRPAKTINELTQLSSQQLMRFLDSICATGRFRYILADFPARISDCTLHLLKSCHNIFLIDDGSPLSLWKNKKFIENITEEVYEEIQDQIKWVTNKWIPEAQEKQEEEVFHIRRLFVEYDKESFISEGFYTDISLQRCFGLGVKKIADECTAKM